MQKSVLIVAIPVVLFFICEQCLNYKRTKECDGYSELDGFKIQDNVFNDHEMQEFEGGDTSDVCKTKVFVSNDRLINDLNVNATLKYHDVSLRTNVPYESIEKLLAHGVLKKCGVKGMFLTTSLSFSGSPTNNKTVITAVRTKNTLQKGYARISSGGVLQDHVELQLRSDKSDGFEYEISVYGLV